MKKVLALQYITIHELCKAPLTLKTKLANHNSPLLCIAIASAAWAHYPYLKCLQSELQCQRNQNMVACSTEDSVVCLFHLVLGLI